jgi:hypothetical protein
MTTRMIASQAGVALLAAVFGVAQVSAEATPHEHVGVMNSETVEATTVVHRPAGPMLQDKLSRSI